MADTRDDDFDSANPFRALNKRAFRDARAQKATSPAAKAGARSHGHGGQAHKAHQRPGTSGGTDEARSALPPLSEEDAEAFLSAMGAVQRLDAPKKPGKGTPGKRGMEQTPAPVVPEMPASAVPAAERDKLAATTAARLDADAARNGFALQDQPGFKLLLEQTADAPDGSGPPHAGSMPGKPDAVPVTASERKEAVRQRSRQAVADHEHTPPPDEDNLFTKAMTGVRTLAGKGREVPPETAPREAAAPAVGHPLQDFMDGAVEFALEFTDEYLEGHVVGLDALTVGKLRAGQYSPEGHLDLHGMNALQAYESMVGFLRRVVLAFCTAQPAHGGAGALYVLLRKYKKSRGKIQWDRTPTDADLFL